MSKKPGEIFEKLFVILFVVWFIGSIGMMLVFSELGNGYMTLLLFGQYFFVFSLVAFSNSDAPLFILAHLTIGILAMLVPTILRVLPRFSDLSKINYIEIISCIIFIILGYILLIISRNKEGNVFKKLFISSIISFILGIAIMIRFCI